MIPDRPTTGVHGPTKGVRERASSSDVHTSTPRIEPISGAPEWVRLLQAQLAQSEGRMMAEIVAVEKRIEVRRESRELAELSAQLTMTSKDRDRARATNRLFRWATGGSSSVAVVALVTALARSCGQQEIATKAERIAAETAEQTAEQKAAELATRHEETRQIAVDAKASVEALDRKLDQVLELLQRPTPVEVPAPKKSKGR